MILVASLHLVARRCMQCNLVWRAAIMQRATTTIGCRNRPSPSSLAFPGAKGNSRTQAETTPFPRPGRFRAAKSLVPCRRRTGRVSIRSLSRLPRPTTSQSLPMIAISRGQPLSLSVMRSMGPGGPSGQVRMQIRHRPARSLTTATNHWATPVANWPTALFGAMRDRVGGELANWREAGASTGRVTIPPHCPPLPRGATRQAIWRVGGPLPPAMELVSLSLGRMSFFPAFGLAFTAATPAAPSSRAARRSRR
jgi:hypothetical protein